MAKRSKKKKAVDSQVSGKTGSTRAIALGLPSWLGRDWPWGLLLILAVIVAYLPVWRAGYIWDDDIHLAANPCIIGPLGLKEIWTTSVVKFCPFVFTTFWVEHALWGLAPMPYHVVNVLLHGASAVLLWMVLRRLQVPGAWLGAALWALHPVQVESVAWVSEMKNTESGLFFLLTILFFLRWLKTRDLAGQSVADWNYGLTLLFAFLAMASKSSTVILPGVLALCAWWSAGRWQWRNMMAIGPIFLTSILAAGLTLWNTGPKEPFDPQWVRTWPERLVTAGDAVWFYLGKLLWPHPLAMIYPRWDINAGQLFSYLPLVAVIIISLILWIKRESWARPFFLAWTFFIVALLPVLGLIDMTFSHYSFVADHFQYLADMGPLALAGAGLARWANSVLAGRSWLQASLCVGLLLVLGISSWQRVWAFGTEETLWTDTLAKNPDCWAGYNNLGHFYLQKGKLNEAQAQFQEALKLYPNYDLAYNNLGDVLLEQGALDQAIADYQKAVEINPGYVRAQSNLGWALCANGQVDEAIVQYQKALKIAPGLAEIHNNLGYALYKKGEMDEATVEYQKSIDLDPNDPQGHYNFGYFLFHVGKMNDAAAQFQRTLEIAPRFIQARDNLGWIFFQKGQLDEAVDQFQDALKLNPSDSHARSGLAQAEAAQRQSAAPK